MVKQMKNTVLKKYQKLSDKEMSQICGGKWVTIDTFLRPTGKCLKRDEFGNCLEEIQKTYQIQQQFINGEPTDNFREVKDR